MRWIAKALTKKVLSHVPGGDEIDYFLQRSLTKSLPQNDASFLHHAEIATRHVNSFREHNAMSLDQVRCLEFGAGWDLVSPLVFYALGIRKQTLIDISLKVHLDLVNHTLHQCHRLFEKLALRAPRADFSQLPVRLNSLTDLSGLGINHIVGDLRTIECPRELDMITSISTLELIPASDIPSIMQRCYELLRPRGLLVSTIDTADHYARFDRSITHINFLKYSPGVWSVFNSPLYYQNRLRVSDHLRIMEQAGFSILQATRMPIKKRPNVRIHPVLLQKYDFDELLCGGVFVSARK